MSMISAVIVDDDSDLAQILLELLKVKKIKTLGIGQNGIDVIKIVNEKKPDLLFLDVNMPQLNGIEVLKEIRKNSYKPIVIILTIGRMIEEKKLFEYGASYVIFKPFDLPQIMRVLEKVKVLNNTLSK